MIFLPIVERELRAASRRRGTYWGRFSAAVVAVFAGAWVLVLAEKEFGSAQDAGPILFGTLAALVFIYIAIAGILLTCDCLSVEKREGTLGLLFLTDLRGYDVVLGKLAATSINACYGILAVLPVLAIPLLLGGVTNGEFWRVALVSANLLFFFLCVGIFSSSVTRQDQTALALSVSLALFIVLAPLLAFAWLQLRNFLVHDEIWVLLACPAFDCVAAFDAQFKTSQPAFWSNAAITQIYAWTFLLLACFIVPRSWQQTVAGPDGGPWLAKWRAFAGRRPGARAAARVKLLAINPFLWRAARPGGKTMYPWLFLGVAAAGWWVCGRLAGAQSLFAEPGDMLFALVVNSVLKLWVASEGCRCLAEDRRTGTLELLLTTPLTGEEIVRGQRKALWRQFAGPVTAVLLMDLLFLIMALRGEDDPEQRTVDFCIYLSTATFLVLDMYALSWLSLWMGVAGRKPVRAISLSYCLVVVVPALVTFVCAVLFSLAGWINWEISYSLWIFVSLTADGIFAGTARVDLLGRLRERVAEGFWRPRTPPPTR